MIRKFEPGRALEVIKPKYGSAYRIGGRLVLTAAHLLSEVDSSCCVRSKQSFGEIEARVVWKALQADIALIELPEEIESCEAIVFGLLPESSGGETLKFQMYGYPQWGRTQREEGSAAGGRQVEGTIFLADTSPDGLLPLETLRSPEGSMTSDSSWKGYSGAAVVCDGLVIAVQHWHQNPERPESLEASPLSIVYSDEQWCDLLKEHGINPEPAIARVEEQTLSQQNRKDSYPAGHVEVGPDKSRSRYKDKITDISNFVGRAKEINELEQWIVQEQYRMIAIVGIGGLGKSALAMKFTQGGIGKTSLAAKVVDNVEYEFKDVIWLSLINDPSLEETLSVLIKEVSEHKKSDFTSVKDAIDNLLSLLKSDRYLIVLDNVETILEGQDDDSIDEHQRNLAIRYRQGREEYGYLFNMLGRTDHLSCVLLTSREKPEEIVSMNSDSRLPVKIMDLNGLNIEDGKKIFERFNCQVNTEEDWRKVVDLYGGNPLALELASAHINDIHFGNVSDFIEEGQKAFSNIKDLLVWHFERLSSEQKEIMYWLAINRDPVSSSELHDDILPEKLDTQKQSSINLRNLVLPGLKQRIPVILERRQNEQFFALQPVLIEFMTDQLIHCVCNEIRMEKPLFLGKYALSKASTNDSMRRTQNRLILAKIVRTFGKSLEIKLRELIPILRQDSFLRRSYASGNILNLLSQIQRGNTNQNQSITLRDYDFSDLEIRQAYLDGINLPGVNFSRCTFYKSSFTRDFGRVKSLAFSPKDPVNEKVYLLTGHDDQKARLWDIETGYFLCVCHKHTDWIRAVAFSPTGKIFATGSDDQTIRLWDFESSLRDKGAKGRCIGEALRGHDKWIWSLAFSPDGTLLASASGNTTVKIWDVSDVKKAKFLRDLIGHNDQILSISFSSDGCFLASGSVDQTIILWNIRTGKFIKIFEASNAAIESVSLSKDGQYLASGSKDGKVTFWSLDWSLETFEQIESLDGHKGQVKSVCFSPSDTFPSLLASSGSDCKIKLWDVSVRNCIATLDHEHTDTIEVVRFSCDGSVMASGGDDREVRLWDVQSKQCLRTLRGFTNWVWSVAFSPDDANILASANGDWTIRLWDVEKKKCFSLSKEHKSAAMSVAFRHDSRILASCSDDSTLKLWSIIKNSSEYSQALECIDESSQGHSDKIKSICFSPNGLKLASAGYDSTIMLWDVESGDDPRLGDCVELGKHDSHIWRIIFSPDGKLLASCSSDGTIKLWNVRTSKLLTTFDQNTPKMHKVDNEIWSVAFNSDGTRLASGSEDKTVKLWNIENPESPFCLHTLEGHSQWIWSVAFSLSGCLVASGSGDHTVKLWDVQTGECLKTFKDHTDCVWTVAFSHNNQRLASGSSDETIKVWNISDPENATLEASLRAERPYEGMNIKGANFTKPTRNSLVALGAVEI